MCQGNFLKQKSIFDLISEIMLYLYVFRDKLNLTLCKWNIRQFLDIVVTTVAGKFDKSEFACSSNVS